MRLKQYLAGSLLALSVLAGACSSEEIVDNSGAVTPDENQATLVFNFSGLRLPGSAPVSRAEDIATQDETVVESLVIILAGVDSETSAAPTGTKIIYEYRSNWGATVPPDGTNPLHKKLELIQNGNVLSGKLLVDETVMKPEYLSKRALILVNGVQLVGGMLNDPTNVDVATTDKLVGADFDVLYAMCGGKIGGKTLTDIGMFRKLIWGPADLTAESIATPLPMTGEIANINFHGSTNVNVPLVRAVSRFDLRNGQSAELRIGSIRPLQAVAGIDETLRVDMMDQDLKIGATDPNWADVASEVAPAFYTFPSPLSGANQQMKFRVTAKKLNGNTGVWEDKTYTLELKDANGKVVSVDRNTRYVINIKEVTDAHLVGSIEIVEWEQGGDIDGDIPTNAYSRKVPTMNDMTDDTANQILWTLNNTLPTGLAFGNARPTQTITFTTPKVADVVAGATTDEPMVSVDIFSEDPTATDWLTWTQATDGVTGVVTHTLTVKAGVTAFGPMQVKVKNYYYPEHFILFRVTGVKANSILIDVPGSNGGNGPITLPGGGFQIDDSGSENFETGTVVVP